ncbi:MAG: Asp-tRNA(Asn)/Glu-tRNA(Gln) amidotransferase subunit GatB [Candidatus Magasanikbacteria bacterium]|nr:Asp-tRNA(Asn)/Glu-tRNA(Gln) amidotransferase subunit GatB [Candidatus Magasanikbacteria bacterium]
MPRITIIGLEIHARLKTKSKMFCSCPNVDDATAPNTAICPICTGQPGALPAVNQEAVHLGVRLGLALGCRIPDEAHFDRKNYFYPDLPKGYQISQFDHPICIDGELWIDVPGQEAPRDRIRVGITRAHLEEDAAKNSHDGASQATLVDYNRGGSPLIEIVSEPDLRSPAEAKAYVQEMQNILRAIGSSAADMEKGHMRCDANISLLEVDENGRRLQDEFNPKVEIKNLNSFRSVEHALTYEIARQNEMHDRGEIPQGATRGWDENTGKTFEQRSKENSADYRYFPEPDLPPLVLSAIREQEKTRLPELPAAKRARLVEEYQFTADDVKLIVSNGWTDFADQIMSELKAWMNAANIDADISKLSKLMSGWLLSKLPAILTQKEISFEDLRITPENFAEFVKLVYEGAVSSTNAQKLLALMVDSGADPSQLMEDHTLGQISDPAMITETVERLIAQNPQQTEQIKNGEVKLVKWFVGCVMKATEGRINPELAEEELKKQLGVS